MPYTQEMQKAAIDEATLRLLACPVCHAALALSAGGMIICTDCGRQYPVRDGLPILLASAAQR